MTQLNILLCPLDWGLGHATRCVPIVNELLGQGHRVILGVSDPKQQQLFNLEFPHLTQIEFPAYNIKYPQKSWQMPIWILKEVPHILRIAHRESKFLRTIVPQHQIDVIISDNRFGFSHPHTFNIYITHQVLISFPHWARWFEAWGRLIHRFLYRKFQQVWIPDTPQAPGLAGKLSHSPCSLPVQWLGPLSRLAPHLPPPNFPPNPELEILAIISGPEPQRSDFETFAIAYANRWHTKSIVLRGMPHLPNTITTQGAVEIHNHASAAQMAQWIASAKKIICRSGYSTIMDLAFFDKEIEWFPTLGQTEQEYLAELHHNSQKSLSLQGANSDLLQQTIANLAQIYTSWKSNHE